MKIKTLSAVVCTLAFSGYFASPAIAAELSNGSSQACDGLGVWHFVNNQTGGAAAGTLTAIFDLGGATATYVAGASTVNRSNQHFYVTTDGAATLQSASTELPGKLVLSDFACDGGGGKKDDPPKK